MDEDCRLTIKVGDFGVANQGNPNESNLFFTFVGTPEYMAPERFGATHTKVVDSWALGCLLFRVLTGNDLFTTPLAICQYEYTRKPCLGEELHRLCPPETIDFIDKLVQPKVESRATPKAALEHSWLHGLPGEFGRRLATQTLKSHFDSVKRAGLKPRSHIISNGLET